MSELTKDFYNEYRNEIKYAEKVAKDGLSKMQPLIITCAITGAIQGAEANPALPETIDAQVSNAYDIYNAGASIIHIHARNKSNLSVNSSDVNDYKEVNAKVREKCPDIIVNNTCMGGRFISEEALQVGPMQLYSLDAKPEIASIDLTNGSTYMPLKARKGNLSGRDNDTLVKFNYMMTQNDALTVAQEMINRDIKPELELFSVHDMNYVYTLIKKGLVQKPYWIQMLFGGNGTYPNIDTMVHAAKMLPEDSLLSVIGVGHCQTAMITLAMIMGHHVRVGLEDNVFYRKGELATSNAQLVERVIRIAKELGRPIATPAQAREMLGLGAPRQYTF